MIKLHLTSPCRNLREIRFLLSFLKTGNAPGISVVHNDDIAIKAPGD